MIVAATFMLIKPNKDKVNPSIKYLGILMTQDSERQ